MIINRAIQKAHGSADDDVDHEAVDEEAKDKRQAVEAVAEDVHVEHNRFFNIATTIARSPEQQEAKKIFYEEYRKQFSDSAKSDGDK